MLKTIGIGPIVRQSILVHHELSIQEIVLPRTDSYIYHNFICSNSMYTVEIRDKLKNKGLRITPQRMSILDALYSLGNHPTARQIIDYVHQNDPHVAQGTIYKTLDTLTSHGVIAKVRTIDEATRYDGRVENHHHIYSNGEEQIEDYVNSDLDLLLKDFFRKNGIPNYEIESIRLHIHGKKVEP